MQEFRVGIIGAGGIAAQWHLPELRTVEQAHVTLVSGRKESRLQRLCEVFDIPRYSVRYEAVLESPDVDGVIIALPHPLHVEWGLKALAAGKHLLMQKPLCTSLEQADQFVAAAEQSDRVVLALPWLSRPNVLACRELIRQGQLGQVTTLRARHSHGGPEIYYAGVQEFFGEAPPETLWFFDHQQADVGALFDMGVYSLSTLVALGGSVEEVTARCETVAKPTQLEDTASVILKFAGGAIGTAETSWCDPARTSEFSVHGTLGKLVSSPREQELRLYQPSSLVDEHAPLRETRVDVSPFPARNAHQEWADCVRTGRAPELSHVRMARHITEILLAALESSRQQRTIRLRTCLT